MYIGLGRLAQVEHIYLGDRKLSVRTSVLEEKATACTMLCCYADELKEGFYPYVEQVCMLPEAQISGKPAYLDAPADRVCTALAARPSCVRSAAVCVGGAWRSAAAALTAQLC